MWSVQKTTLSFLNFQRLKSRICCNFMLNCFPSRGAKKAGSWKLMSTVLAWPVFCLLGLEVFGRVSDVMQLLRVPHALLGEYWHPALPNLSQWPKDTRANQTWIMQPTNTWWPQNWVGCLLFKAMTSALDLPPLSPSTIGGLGPKRSEIQLRELPKTVFCFEDLWRTLEEWCSTAKHSAHWWENAWMGGLATSQAEDEAGSSGTFLLTPVIFSWPWI